MKNIKPKEPLLAVMLAFMVAGLGQVYAGKIMRGIIFFAIWLVLTILLITYFLSPTTTTNSTLLLLFIAGAGYGIFVIVDAYRCAKAYNFNNNLVGNVTTGKKILLIAGIIFFGVIINPVQIGIALYVRGNIVQAFKIVSKGMEPALLQGDRILVDKTIYKKSEPKRGGIIVFSDPAGTKKDFVQRLVGLPEEIIEMKGGSVLINGTIVSEPSLAEKYYYNSGDYAKEGQSVQIPADSYYLLLDNRASNRDRRYFGFVSKKYLIGKAYKIYYPFDRSGAIK